MNNVAPDRDPPLPEHELLDLVSKGADLKGDDLDKTRVDIPVPPDPSTSANAKRYGRYTTVRKLGEGGMGAVFLACDTVTGQQVALKVLSDSCLKDSDAFQRFEKEARLLEEAKNPHIANMLDMGREGETRYLVMEYVEGTDLRRWLARREPLDEATSLDMISDLCRGLATIHARGMVHRDVKPENVLLSSTQGSGRPVVKLTDFGLARHIDQSESLKLTQTGALLGTPYYMSPEQFKGTGEISAATDVYAIGVTLFEMLTGRRPFQANDPIKLAAAHCFEPPPDLRKLIANITDGTAELVSRTLSKDPASRPPDAAALLEDIVRLRSGAAAQLAMHPALPEHDARKVVAANFEWNLIASPESLWPYVSDTDRFNQAAGIPPVTYEMVRDENGQSRKIGQFRMAGLTIKWEEHPFEWIERRRFSVLREFAAGPFVWFLSTVELAARPEGGTLLKHYVKILPRGLAGRLLASLEVGFKGRRNIDRVYRRIDATINSRVERVVDHFQQPPTLTSVQRIRLKRQLDQLKAAGVGNEVVSVMEDLVTNAAAQVLARLRPYALARRFGLPERDVVQACLHAVRLGLLTMHWDLICPSCRLSADAKQTLREIDQHTNCSACQSDFKAEFSSSIELVFRVHNEIRTPDSRLYCNGGPGNFPHVVAQVTLEPGERFLMSLALEPGSYILRGPRLPYTVPIEVDARSGARHGSVQCAPGREHQVLPIFLAGQQQIMIENSFSDKQVLRVERNARRSDALTAAEATALPLFRQMFPQETLAPGQLVELATTNFLAIQWDDLDATLRKRGDSSAYQLLAEFRRIAERQISLGGGSTVDEQNGLLLATFADIESAIHAACRLRPALFAAVPRQKWCLSGALHRGSALVTSDRQGISYFGAVVSQTLRLARQATPGQLLLTQDIWSDPGSTVSSELHSDRDDSLRWVDLNKCGADSKSSHLTQDTPS